MPVTIRLSIIIMLFASASANDGRFIRRQYEVPTDGEFQSNRYVQRNDQFARGFHHLFRPEQHPYNDRFGSIDERTPEQDRFHHAGFEKGTLYDGSSRYDDGSIHIQIFHVPRPNFRRIVDDKRSGNDEHWMGEEVDDPGKAVTITDEGNQRYRRMISANPCPTGFVRVLGICVEPDRTGQPTNPN